MPIATLDTPAGTLWVAVDQQGAVTKVHFGDPDQPIEADQSVAGLGDAALAAVRQLAAYFAGERTDFDLPLAPSGTPFQRRVWAALRQIPFGATLSYGEIAALIGQPTASRAVGLANARNPIAIIVPCHRVIGRNGALTGYAGGMDRKRWLLQHERQAEPVLV